MKKSILMLNSLLIIILLMGCSANKGVINKHLKDKALLSAFKKLNISKTFIAKEKVEVFGYAYEEITYVSGQNIKSETKDGAINIYNAKEQTSYAYIKGEKKGFKSTKDKQTFYDMNEIYTSDITFAKIIKYNNEDVLYVEVSDDIQTEKLVLWISLKYAYPLKVNMYIADQLFLVKEVSEIAEYTEDTKNLFIPPDYIIFDDYANAS